MLKGRPMEMASIDLISKKTICTCSTLFFSNEQNNKICTCSTLFAMKLPTRYISSKTTQRKCNALNNHRWPKRNMGHLWRNMRVCMGKIGL